MIDLLYAHDWPGAIKFMKGLGLFILFAAAIPFTVQRKLEQRKQKRQEKSLK